MSERFTKTVEDILKVGGWFPGRRVPVPPNPCSPLEFFPSAREIMAEFGGLHIGSSGPGIERATSDVRMDPASAAHFAPELTKYGEMLHTKLYPLGQFHRDHGYVVLDITGRLYLLIENELEFFASSFAKGLEMLLLGKISP